jgi:hypothetical protein
MPMINGVRSLSSVETGGIELIPVTVAPFDSMQLKDSMGGGLLDFSLDWSGGC